MDRITPLLTSPEQRHHVAALLAAQGGADRAIPLLEDPKNPASASSDLMLARLYGQQNRLDKVEEIIRKLMDKPTPDLATIQMAVALYTSTGRRDEAEKALAAMDKLKLDPPVKDLVWGSYYQQVGEMDKALKSYRQATQAAPADPVAWRTLAGCLALMGQLDEAFAVIDQARKAIPDDKALAAIKQQSALLREAGRDADLRPIALAIMRDPANSAVNVELLRTLVEGYRAGNMENLAFKLDQFREKYPASQLIHVALIRCHGAMGRTTDALASLRRALDAFPNSAEIAQLAVDFHLGNAQWKDAIAAAQNWKKRARPRASRPMSPLPAPPSPWARPMRRCRRCGLTWRRPGPSPTATPMC